MTARVSVLIPTFNRAALVQEAIDSVLHQRGSTRFEIIVIDDGSSDGTREALERYGDAIRYVRQENAGLNASRNRALSLASGEYVALLDDDDVWLPFKTALELDALRRFPDAAFVHSNFFIWKPGIGQRPKGLSTWHPDDYTWDRIYSDKAQLSAAGHEAHEQGRTDFDVYCGDLYYWSLFTPMVLPSTAIIRRAAIDDDLRFPEFDPTCGDWDFFARISHRHGAVFVDAETTLNRSHEDPWRLTRVESSVQVRRRIAMIRRLWRGDASFLKEHEGAVDRIEAQCLRQLIRRQLVIGETGAARESLRELRQLSAARAYPADIVLSALAYVPFSRNFVGALRAMRTRVSGSGS